MDKFVKIQKRGGDENKASEESESDSEPSTKKSKGDCDAETLNPKELLSQELKKKDAPLDISKSAADNPVQPRLREYPKHSEGKSNAPSFVGVWFEKYRWAEYSQDRDAMFCFSCRHFTPPAYGNADDAFIKSGFRRWKKAQMKSQCHKLSYVAWTDYQSNKAKETSVAQIISAAYQKKVKENRHYIKTLGEIILLTVTQNIAQRGHREGDAEQKPGNVRKFLKFTAKHDPVIADRVKDGPKNEKYTSSAIQNEIIQTLASMVKEEIAESGKSSRYFFIQADEAKDVSKTEQLSLVVRFFYETSCSIQECFISFTPMIMLDAASITDTILRSLEMLGLDYQSSLVGLRFDGASVMSGKLSGVQKRMRDSSVICKNDFITASDMDLIIFKCRNIHLLVAKKPILRRFSWPSLAYMCTKVA